MRRLVYCFVVIALVGISAKAQAFSDPIPVVVDQGQHSAHGTDATVFGTHTEATNLIFGEHPSAPGAEQNFHTTEVIVEGIDDPIKIQDIVATPGMLPTGEGEDLADMILNTPVLAGYLGHDDAGTRITSMNPAQAFCPDAFRFTLAPGMGMGRWREQIAECSVLSNFNRSNFQLELADIKNVSSSADYDRIGNPALVPGVIGSAEQSKYPGDNYPSTISSHDFPYTWVWGFNRLSASNRFVLSYGLSVFDNALVSAAYDPVFITYQNIMGNYISKGNPNDTDEWYSVSRENITFRVFPRLYTFLASHISPLIAYYPQAGSVKLAGYSSWQFDELDFTSADTFRYSLLGRRSDPGFILKLLMGMNINTIDVKSIFSEDEERLAVINQATLGSLNQCVRGPRGVCFPDGTWREALRVNSIGAPGEYYLPHDVVSYLTIWEKGDSQREINSPNLNIRWDPKAFALIGPGVYSSAVMSEPEGDKYTKRYLLVPSGEPAVDNNFYVYKIAPKVTGENMVHFYDNGLSGILPQPIQVHPPAPGFGPYEIKTADFDGNGCDDFTLTWRGTEILLANPDERFENDYEQAVYFRSSAPEDDRMFNNCFSVYMATRQADGTCIYEDNVNMRENFCDSYLGEARPQAQITSVAINDFNDDGSLDVLAGNQLPMQLDNNQFAAHGLLFENIQIGPEETSEYDEDELVRVGFKTAQQGPEPTSSGSAYLQEIAAQGFRPAGDDLNQRAGVAKLNVDENGNIGAITGLPLMLPKMGCPNWDDPNNAEVQSPIESYLSIHYNRLNIDPAGGPFDSRAAARDGAGNIMPMRCGVREPVAYDCPVVPHGDDSYLVLHDCCTECGDVMAAGDFYSCWEYCNPTHIYREVWCASSDPVFRTRCRLLENMCAGLEPCLGDGTIPCTNEPPPDYIEMDCCPALTASDENCENIISLASPDPAFGNAQEFCLDKYYSYCYSEYETYQTFCDLMRPCADDGASLMLPNERSQHYACNIDRVYDSKAAFIARLADLSPAQYKDLKKEDSGYIYMPRKIKEPEPMPERIKKDPGLFTRSQDLIAGQGRIKPVKPLGKITPIPMVIEQEFKKMLMSSEQMTEQQANDTIRMLRKVMLENENSLPVMLIQPFLNMITNMKAEEEPAQDFTPELKLKQKTSWLDKLTDLFINEAQAYEVPGLETNTRFPRGKVMPGLREMTVVLKGEFPSSEDPTEPTDPTDPTDPCPPCETECCCPCPCACEPTETSPCAVEDEVQVVSRCSGWSSPATKKLGMDMNKKIRDAIREGDGEPLDNDFYCESEALWKVWVNVPQSANITKAASTGSFSGQVANSLLLQRGGNVLEDYKKRDRLPSKTNLISQPMIILPPPSDVSVSGKAITVPTPDLSLASQAAEVSINSLDTSLSANLSDAVPVPADLVSSVSVAEDSTLSFNNVLRWQRQVAPTQGRAVDSDIGSAVHLIEIDTPPMLCSWTARCPDTESGLPENSFANLDFDVVLEKMRDHGRLCQNGICAPEFFELTGWPAYQRLNFALVQQQNVPGSASAMTTKAASGGGGGAGIKVVPFAGISGMTMSGKGGGGCGCLINGQKANQVSMIAMFLMVAMLGGGYVLVRRKVKS